MANTLLRTGDDYLFRRPCLTMKPIAMLHIIGGTNYTGICVAFHIMSRVIGPHRAGSYRWNLLDASWQEYLSRSRRTHTPEHANWCIAGCGTDEHPRFLVLEYHDMLFVQA
jgi:hypothetical protein